MTAKVTENYTYSGTGGRTSNYNTEFHNNDSLFSRHTQGWSYDALGQTTQTRYPRCIGGTCATNTMPSKLRDQPHNQGSSAQTG